MTDLNMIFFHVSFPQMKMLKITSIIPTCSFFQTTWPPELDISPLLIADLQTGKFWKK
jgi:hypothetical protein